MIPRVIHYIWLSDEPLNTVAEKCIASWHEHASDYEIKRWSMNHFDFSSMPEFVTQAMEHEKWAFACDYLRLYVLYNEGGIYLDSDVLMRRSIGSLFNHRFVSSIEYYPNLFAEHSASVDENGIASVDYVTGLNLQAAVMASEPGHPFVKSCMNFYKDKSFVNPDGTLNTKIVAPQIYSYVARNYGFRYVDEEQVLENDMFLYPSEIFAPGYYEAGDKSVAIHLCNGSWRDMNRLEEFLNYRTKNKQIEAIR